MNTKKQRSSTGDKTISDFSFDKSRPIYMQFADFLTSQIAEGNIKSGDALPSERRLAEDFEVSRVTVRKAVEQLAVEGLVLQRPGSGTYVAKRVSQPLSVLTSFSQDVRARGMVPNSTILKRGIGTATAEEVMALGISIGTEVLRIERLRFADDQPLAIEASTISASALSDPEIIGESLYEALDQVNMRPVRAMQKLSAVALDTKAANLLDASIGAPGLLIVRIGYSDVNQIVEFTRSTFRGDRWDFITELNT